MRQPFVGAVGTIVAAVAAEVDGDAEVLLGAGELVGLAAGADELVLLESAVEASVAALPGRLALFAEATLALVLCRDAVPRAALQRSCLRLKDAHRPRYLVVFGGTSGDVVFEGAVLEAGGIEDFPCLADPSVAPPAVRVPETVEVAPLTGIAHVLASNPMV